MKKIILYTDTPIIGGAELQIFLLAKFLNKKLFTPILVCPEYPSLNSWVEKFEKEHITVHRLKVKNKRDLKHYTALNQIIKTQKPHLLHIHIWNPASCRHAFFSGKKHQIPIITTEHDPFKLPLLKNIFKKHTLNSVSKIITVSQENQKLLQTLYPKHQHKIHTIPNGIDLTWWQSQVLSYNQEDRKKIKEELFKAQENTLIILTIAALHERKGLTYAISALPPLLHKFPNIKLIIVGEGPERKKLQQQIQKLHLQKNAILLGKQNNIPYLLKSTDIFLLPSNREAFGLVNLEAMTCALPIIATQVGGIPEIIIHNKTGLLIKPQNPHAITTALKKLIENSSLRHTLGQNGYTRLINTFSAQKMADQYQSIYQQTLDGESKLT